MLRHGKKLPAGSNKSTQLTSLAMVASTGRSGMALFGINLGPKKLAKSW
jgi:hypothetical protein